MPRIRDSRPPEWRIKRHTHRAWWKRAQGDETGARQHERIARRLLGAAIRATVGQNRSRPTL